MVDYQATGYRLPQKLLTPLALYLLLGGECHPFHLLGFRLSSCKRKGVQFSGVSCMNARVERRR